MSQADCPRTYRKLESAAHGWLEVPLADIHDLQIENTISVCSYLTPTHVYLEEDQDMGLFLKAARTEGWSVACEFHRIMDAPEGSGYWPSQFRTHHRNLTD